MKRVFLFLLIFIVIGVGIYAAFFRQNREINVLIFSKTSSFRHESIPAGIEAIRGLAGKYDFKVEATEDASYFNEETLSGYNVVVFLNTTGDILNDAQQLEFNRWVQAGGGFVGIHAAADTEYDWPWYGKLVGAYFNGHPNDPNVREATVEKVDTLHMTVSHLAKKWRRADEWYNYKEINPEIQVLLNLDEKSYEGGTNGDTHPITWYHDFDGGRSFYTGLGHTIESYQDPLFLDLLWKGIDYAAGPGQPVNYDLATVAPEENRFSRTVLAKVFNEPMELEILPGDQILLIERRGKIKLFDPEKDSIQTVASLPVHTGHEDGLLGLAKDPEYENNHWIYLYYSPVGNEAKQHLSRFEFKDGKLHKESEKILLEIPTQREECCHAGGSIEFGPDGLLYLSTGDNTNPHESEGYSPSDEREGRSAWDAQKSSANTHDLRGKVLRIKPEADGSYSIPEGNLFARDGSEGRPEIYVMGCRNPFRISIDQKSGYLYWGDVGPDAGEDHEARGSRGYDEVNQARQAGFFGWPYFIGDNQAYYEFDFASQSSGKLYDPEKPINNSPNNTGAQSLPPAQKAFIWYPYGVSTDFPLVGEGGRNAMAGPVYYESMFDDASNRFPDYYDGKLFTYDWMRGWMMAVTMDKNGDFVRMERFLPNTRFSNPVDMAFSPNGDLYILEYGTNWFRENEDAALSKISFVSGNRQPVAKFELNQSSGALPLLLEMDASTSIDFDGDSLQYNWVLNGKSIGTGQKNTYSIETGGSYELGLIVKDPEGEQASYRQTIIAGNTKPQIEWVLNGNTSFYFEDASINYEVKVKDAEDGNLGSGIDPQAVAISMDYLPRGMDKNEIELGHQANMEASVAFLGEQLIAISDCKSCHQLAEQSVGPDYRSIAQKYKGDPSALEHLSNKIIKGGGGVWGEVMMAAHPQLSYAEASQMVKYILSLEEGVNLGPALPAKGNYTMDQHKKEEVDGMYIFSASYTDKGGDNAEALSARSTYILRNPMVQAEDYDAGEQAMRFEVTPDMVPGLEEAFEIAIARKGTIMEYHQLDLTNVQSLTLGAMVNRLYFSGGTVEVRSGNKEGELLGRVDLKKNLKMELSTYEIPIKASTGKQDVILLFNAAPGGEDATGGVCALDWIKFKAASAN